MEGCPTVFNSGLEIATDATKTWKLATKNSSLVATLANYIPLIYKSLKVRNNFQSLISAFLQKEIQINSHIKNLSHLLLVFNNWISLQLALPLSGIPGIHFYLWTQLLIELSISCEKLKRTNKTSKKFWNPGLCPCFSCENMF